MRVPTGRGLTPAIVGSGVAGLSAALASDGCVVVTAGSLGQEGSSPLAQGGIAAAIGPDDSTERHRVDTHAVAGGLALDAAVRAVTDGGPSAIAHLLELGAEFDRSDDGELSLGREAGHSARRIVHANGDGSGAALMATLVDAVRARSDIEVLEHTTVVDLVLAGEDAPDRVGGLLITTPTGEPVVLPAPTVVLATGGYAHCFARTTTPSAVIGSGLAMAARAGVRLADLEFVQFHPTAMDVETASSLPLLTEALRGEGATLINDRGQRFMVDEHPAAELAPRDVVARAIYRQVVAGNSPRLDCRSAIGSAISDRFPTVFALATRYGFDPRVEAVPVTPAAHYCMGGVATDVDGRTSLPGLLAVGEVASTGLHGANRLASNSLLEGLVLGRAVGSAIARWGAVPADRLWVPVDHSPTQSSDRALVTELRTILWTAAGVERDESRLLCGLDALAERERASGRELRARTIHTVGTLVVQAALARGESRGAHFRLDASAAEVGGGSRSMASPAAVRYRPLPLGEGRIESGLRVA